MNPRILIVDRSEHFIGLITVRLLNLGYDNFRTAKCGRDGLKIVDLENPKVVLMETRLEDIDGFKVCQLVKEVHGEDVKVVLMSGMAEESNLAKAKESGADEYVVKTYDCLDILVAMRKQLAEFTIYQS